MANATIGGPVKDAAERHTRHSRKIGSVFSGANSSGGGDGVGSARKIEPCGKDSIHLSDEAMGKEQ